MAILIFVEWNIKEFMHDVRYATATLFISFIIYFLFGMVQNMKIGGYKERFFIPAMITYVYGLSCFCVYFVARFFSNYEEETEEAIIKKAIGQEKPMQGSYEKYSSSVSLNQTSSNGPQKKLSVADRLIGLHNYGDEIKKSYDVLKTSSTNSSTTNLSSTRVNLRKSSRSYSNINDSLNVNNRRASQATQIMAIPENKIAVSYGSSSTNFSPSDSLGQDSSGSDENVHRPRTRSIDYVPSSPNTRVSRINSTPNKVFLGYSMAKKTSYENFPNIGGSRKGSNVSYTNIHPIIGSSYTNLPISRKESVNTHGQNSSSNNVSIIEMTSKIKSSEHIVNIPNNIPEKKEPSIGSHNNLK